MVPAFYWILLRDEAASAGIRIGAEEVAGLLRQVIPQLSEGQTYENLMRYIVGRHRLTEEDVLNTFGQLLAVLQYAQTVCSSESITHAQVRHLASLSNETLDTEFVQLESKWFADKNQTPGDEELRAHFDKYKACFAGDVSEANPFSLASQYNGNTTDNIPPEITVQGIKDGEYRNSDVSVSITVIDTNLDEYSIVVKSNDKIIVSDLHLTLNPYTLHLTGEAEYELTVEATDSAGNIAQSMYEFGIDRTYPVVQIKGVEDGGIYYNEAKPEIEAIDTNLSYIEVTLNTNIIISTNTILIPYTLNLEPITNEGIYTLKATAEDKAGNKVEKNAEFELQVFSPEDVLVFKAEYNTNTDADYAKGDGKDYSGGKITSGNEGKEGEALKSLILGNSHYARYRPDGNIDERYGTIMMWVKPFWETASYKGKDQGRYIFSLYKNSGGKVYSINFAVFEKTGTTAKIRYVDEQGDEYVHTISVDTNADEGERWYKDGSDKWTHLALSWDSTQGIIKIYIDGELRGKKEVEKWEPYYVGSNSWMKVGDSEKGVFTEFWGYIDRFKIYNKPLTDKQVKQIYEKGVSTEMVSE